MRRFRLLLLLLLCLRPAGAQEVSAAMGRLHGIGGKESTYSWQVQYLQNFGPSWAASFTWLNEGHLPDHHRDGASLQVWRFHRMERNSLRLGVGVGTYRYFDTTGETADSGYRNQHGVKPQLSLRAQYPSPSGNWDTFVQVNRILGPGEPQTQSFLLGFTARFAGSASPGSATRDPGANLASDARNEFALLTGRTILNSFESEHSDVMETFALEYRRRLTRHLELSLTYCDEGDIDAAKRDALATQLWLTSRPARGTWLFGFGVGPYFSRVFPVEENRTANATVNLRTSLRYSMLLGRQLWGHWGARLQWNRTLTRYHRDTDVLLTGLAYQW